MAYTGPVTAEILADVAPWASALELLETAIIDFERRRMAERCRWCRQELREGGPPWFHVDGTRDCGDDHMATPAEAPDET